MIVDGPEGRITASSGYDRDRRKIVSRIEVETCREPGRALDPDQLAEAQAHDHL